MHLDEAAAIDAAAAVDAGGAAGASPPPPSSSSALAALARRPFAVTGGVPLGDFVVDPESGDSRLQVRARDLAISRLALSRTLHLARSSALR